MVFTLGSTALTLWYSLGSSPPGDGSNHALHVAAYFVNTLAVLLVVDARRGRSNAWTVVVAGGMVVVGGLLEIVQGTIIDRDAELADWVADAVGVSLAALAFAVVRQRLRDRSSRRLPRPDRR